MQKYFDHVGKGTLAEGAKLVIEKVPVTLRCSSCHHVFKVKLSNADESFPCPKCKGIEATLESGREYHIGNMGVI